MTRLPKKISNNLKELPTGWQSRDEFVIHILNDKESAIQCPSADPNSKSIKDFSKIFFVTPKWKLTKFGCDVLMRTYTWYEVKFTKAIPKTGKMLIKLDRLFTNKPWFHDDYRIVYWDQTIYFELALFDNDIMSYVDFHYPD